MRSMVQFFKNEYKLLTLLLLMVNIPYLLLKNISENKIPTLPYIFIGILIFIRVFFQNQDSKTLFKKMREKHSGLSKQKLVELVEKKKSHTDWAFIMSFIILILVLLLV